MSFRTPKSKIRDLAELIAEVRDLKKQNKRIVTTNGCFDLLHVGHIQYLAQAKELGDVLILLINSDVSVRTLKGKTRPIQSQDHRALQVAALESVDLVSIFAEQTPEAVLSKLSPDFHVKGGDYTPQELPERKVVESHGGKVVCLPLVEGFSTSALIEKIKV